VPRSPDGEQSIQPRTWPTPYFYCSCLTLIIGWGALSSCFLIRASSVALLSSYPSSLYLLLTPSSIGAMRFSTYFLVVVGWPASVLASPFIEVLENGYHKRDLSNSSTSTCVLLSSIGLGPSSTLSVPNATSSIALLTSTGTSTSGVFQWFGVNESGAEFGNTAIPGELGKDYTGPNTSAIEILMKKGMNIFRIPILMELIAPGTMTSALNDTYISGLATTVSFITGAGGHAVIDSHNFGRYARNIIISTSDFQTYWTNVAT
jgi:endoglucanase